MRRSSGRGQVEPLAALAALLAVSAAIVVYVGALDEAIPGQSDSETPEIVYDRVQRTLSTTGVTDPARLDAAMERVPRGWQANVTLTTGGQRWHRGPKPPESAERVRGRVSVGLGAKQIQPGQLRVVVWQ